MYMYIDFRFGFKVFRDSIFRFVVGVLCLGCSTRRHTEGYTDPFYFPVFVRVCVFFFFLGHSINNSVEMEHSDSHF